MGFGAATTLLHRLAPGGAPRDRRRRPPARGPVDAGGGALADALGALSLRRRQSPQDEDRSPAAVDAEDGPGTTAPPRELRFVAATATKGGQRIVETVSAAGMRYTYVVEGQAGQGSFGTVYAARCVETGAKVAIKKVLQDPRYKNRELATMLGVGRHPNVVPFHAWYYSAHRGALFLNLVLEHVPGTLHDRAALRRLGAKGVPAVYVKLYLHQALAALAHLHRLGFAHRDVKPHNILLEPASHVVRLCDFGSAKRLAADEKHVSYIASRYYRAPELIFKAAHYTPAVDLWGVGCVLAKLLLGRPLFTGADSVGQLLAIVHVLGAPSAADLRDMNPAHEPLAFPPGGGKGTPLAEVFRGCPAADAAALDLLGRLLVYSPRRRLTAAQALEHPFFDALRGLEALPDGTPAPPLAGWAAAGDAAAAPAGPANEAS